MISTCPLTVVISPSMADIKDVFPEPTWPTIIVSFPTGILTLMSFRAISSSRSKCQEKAPSLISNTFLASITVRFSETSSSSSVDTPLVCLRRAGSFLSFTVKAVRVLTSTLYLSSSLNSIVSDIRDHTLFCYKDLVYVNTAISFIPNVDTWKKYDISSSNNNMII